MGNKNLYYWSQVYTSKEIKSINKKLLKYSKARVFSGAQGVVKTSQVFQIEWDDAKNAGTAVHMELSDYLLRDQPVHSQKAKQGINIATPVLFLIAGSLVAGPIVEIFSDFYVTLPYRFVPTIVFFAIGVGVLFNKKSLD